MGNLSNLQQLNLEANTLSGSIPPSLSNLLQLIYLELGYNELSDTIPSSLSYLSRLIILSLNNNLLIGSIPASLGNLSNLTNLGLSANQLSGSIPSSLGNLSKLIDLELGNNKLTGNIPPSLGNLFNLEILDLYVNQLSGTIPSILDNFKNMLFTYALNDNKFTFDGMEGIAKAYDVGQYSPQANIPVNYNGKHLSVSAGGTLANDTFYWYKNNVLYQTNVGDSVLSVTTPGYYSVAVTNSIATELTLYSDTIDISSFPEKLLSFTATRQGTQNMLQWTTGLEINTSYFLIERSTNGTNFTTIGKEAAAGNSNSLKQYSFTDNNPVSVNYYRLKEVDKDGQFTYSQIRSINEAISFAASIYPNPVQTNLNITITATKDEQAAIEVIDANGKVLLSQNINIAQGTSSQAVNVSKLAGGNYFITIQTDEGSRNIKFIKE